MSMDIKALALQPRMRVWHPTCMKEGRRQQACGAGFFRFKRHVLRQRMPAKRSALAFVVLFSGTQLNHGTRPFRRAGVEPPYAPPKLEEVSYEYSHFDFSAFGRNAGVSSLRPNFV